VRTSRGAVRARGANQTEYLNNVRTHDLTFGSGPPAREKHTLPSRAPSRRCSRRRPQNHSGAPRRGSRRTPGILPGDLSQKVDPYLRPMYDALYEMMGFERVAKLIERNVIEVAPLAFMRGRSLNDSFVILDEAQNTTNEQMKMFLTRIGSARRPWSPAISPRWTCRAQSNPACAPSSMSCAACAASPSRCSRRVMSCATPWYRESSKPLRSEYTRRRLSHGEGDLESM